MKLFTWKFPFSMKNDSPTAWCEVHETTKHLVRFNDLNQLTLMELISNSAGWRKVMMNTIIIRQRISFLRKLGPLESYREQLWIRISLKINKVWRKVFLGEFWSNKMSRKLQKLPLDSLKKAPNSEVRRNFNYFSPQASIFVKSQTRNWSLMIRN